MTLLEGKKIADSILMGLKKEVKGKNLKLAVVLVGENPASLIFVEEKEKACRKTGIGFELLKLPSEIGQNNLEKEIMRLAERGDISGMVVQLPLPEEINVQEVLDIIPLEKDVDVLSQKSFDKFKTGDSLITPPVAAAVGYLLEEYKIGLTGKKMALVGFGRLVGAPLSAWLGQKGVEFSIIDESTNNADLVIKKADIIISGVGKSGLIKAEMVKDGAVVLDAGSVLKGKKLVGDVDAIGLLKKPGFLAPVPGGIGPLTVACLLENLVKLAE